VRPGHRRGPKADILEREKEKKMFEDTGNVILGREGKGVQKKRKCGVKGKELSLPET